MASFVPDFGALLASVTDSLGLSASVKVHSSMAAQDAVLGLSLKTAFLNASSVQYTGDRQSAAADDFQSWFDKAVVANHAVVIFSDQYRARFTHELMVEGLALLGLKKVGKIRIAIWDPSDGQSAANIADFVLGAAGGASDTTYFEEFLWAKSTTQSQSDANAALANAGYDQLVNVSPTTTQPELQQAVRM